MKNTAAVASNEQITRFHGSAGSTREYSDAEKLQRQHYDSIASTYADHYGDKWSQCYRRKFFNEPMLGDVDLGGMEVLEAMCGSGETTEYLLQRGARVTGLDISEQEMCHFRQRFPTCAAHCGSVLTTGMPDDSFDLVVVVGGLHHIHPESFEAVSEIHRVLKPGGIFCFCEPHKGSLPDLARKLWYRRDAFFADNEAAIDIEVLKQTFSSQFQFMKEVYGGNLAYLLVLNSMVFRIPLWTKPIYSRGLMAAESMIRHAQGKRLSCYVICRWMKRIGQAADKAA